MSRPCRATSPSRPAQTSSGAPSTHVPWPPNVAALHLRADENGTNPVRCQDSGVGNAAADRGQRRVAVLVGRRAPRARPRPAPDLRAARRGRTRCSPSVSVPVLSKQTTSTRANPSTAGSSWTSTLRRARVTAATPKATLVSSTRPWGTMPTMPATVPLTASRQSSSGVVLADEQEHGDREDRPGDVAQDQVDAVHELGSCELEAAGLGGELAGVGVVADGRRLEAARARDHEAAGEHRFAGLLVDRIRLAGEQRLVDLAARRSPARCRRWRSGHRSGARRGRRARRRPPRPRAPRRRARRATRGSLSTASWSRVRLARTSWTMPIERVADQHDAEQRVLGMPDREDHHEQHAQDGVEAREDVRPQDLAEGATRALSARVRLSPFDALSDLGFGETLRWRLVCPLGRNGLARTRRGGHDGESSRGIIRVRVATRRLGGVR